MACDAWQETAAIGLYPNVAGWGNTWIYYIPVDYDSFGEDLEVSILRVYLLGSAWPPPYQLKIGLYTDTGADPGNLIYGSDTLPATAFGYFDAEIPRYLLMDGNRYWVAVRVVSLGINFSTRAVGAGPPPGSTEPRTRIQVLGHAAAWPDPAAPTITTDYAYAAMFIACELEPVVLVSSGHQSLGLSVLAFKPEIGSYTVRGELFDDQIAAKMDALSFEKHADGGWWSAQITLNARLTDAEMWFDEGLNLTIEIYNPALVRIFRGFVNQVDLSAGALSATRGPVLDVANRISMTYTPLLDATISPPIYGAETTTTIADDTDSQGEYGIIESVFSAEPGKCLQTRAEQQRDTFLEELKTAKTSEDAGFSAQNVTQIVLNVLGFQHRLGTYIHQNTTAATVAINTKIEQALASDPNVLFSTDYSNIDTNAFLVNQYEDDNRVADDVIRDLVEIGGATSDERWIFGIYDEEKAHYNAIPTTALYQHRIADKFRRIEKFGTGELVRPWDVKPGEFLFFPDFLIGRAQPTTDLRNDPRYLFIESVTFSTPYDVQINGVQLSTIPQLLAKARILE